MELPSSGSQMPPAEDSLPRVSLLTRLGVGLYGLLILIPDGSTWVVGYPGVLFWQLALLCPVMVLIGQVWSGQARRLGAGLDVIASLAAIVILQSSVMAGMPELARIAGMAAMAMLGTLYALRSELVDVQTRSRWITGYGWLSLVFIAVSLGLWTSQTWLPELQRLGEIQRSLGLTMPFSFEKIENRNWAPIGHQNYVAGYLTLAIPALVGLGCVAVGRMRWLWWGGVALGLLNLYTTTSRAGLFGLVGGLGLAAVVMLGRSQPIVLPHGKRLAKRGLLLGSGGLAMVVLAGAIGTGRLQGIQALLGKVGSGQSASGALASGEFAFRTITNAAGLAMGHQSPWSGMGPGSVLQFYQKFRPAWAGREAELVYQLHSTPAQLWAELGIAGVGVWLLGLGWLGWQWWGGRDRFNVLTQSLFVALFAYSIQSLSDYQFDVLSISGPIILLVAAIAAEVSPASSETAKPSPRFRKSLSLGLMGVLLAAIVALVPVYRAWQLSVDGFNAIRTVNSPEMQPEQRSEAIAQFQQSLEGAHQLVPWEPYYPQQLAWVLGDMGLRSQNPDWIRQSLQWFERAQKTAPHQEFGYANGAWLQLRSGVNAESAQAMVQDFKTATQLVPAKRYGFYSLGLGLLKAGNVEAAVEAFTIEVLRYPRAIVELSQLRRDQAFAPIYDRVLQAAEQGYSEWLKQNESESEPQWRSYLLNSRGALRWWRGESPGAQQDAEASPSADLKAVLALRSNSPLDLKNQDLSPQLAKTLQAWQTPNDRARLLVQAWFDSTKAAIAPEALAQLQGTMAQAKSLEDWIRSDAVYQPVQRSRTGFGVLSRHIDGVQPQDFLQVSENLALSYLMGNFFPDTHYYPRLEDWVQARREALWKQLSA